MDASHPVLPNRWGAGQVLRFSGLDGPTRWDGPFWGITTRRRYEFLLRTVPAVRLRISMPAGSGDPLRWFTGDSLHLHHPEAACWAVFLDADCLVGACRGDSSIDLRTGSRGDEEFPEATAFPVEPDSSPYGPGSRTGGTLFFLALKSGRGRKWALAFDPADPGRAARRAEIGLLQNVPDLCERRARRVLGAGLGIEDLPPDRLRAVRKAFSILRGAYKAPEGQFVAPWGTPSAHHVHLNLWDTLFHGWGSRFLDPLLPRQDALMLLQAQREDGFIGNPQFPPAPHHDARGIHPPLLAWAVWNLHRQGDDRALIELAYPRIVRFIEWVRRNRDADGNGLPEWRETDGCESGRDNDPRWDGRIAFNAVDFSGFLGSELLHLARIADALGRKDEAERWRREHARLAETFNRVFWAEDEDFYFDRALDGRRIPVRTNAAFLALFGGLATAERAERLVRRRLLDPDEFWPELPVPTVSLSDPAHEPDMWRGPVWLCYNHLIVEGLLRYGFRREAGELVERTLRAVTGMYERTGSLWEFYDPRNRREPSELRRKGLCRRGAEEEPGGNIADYTWTAAGYLHFVHLSRRGFGGDAGREPPGEMQ